MSVSTSCLPVSGSAVPTQYLTFSIGQEMFAVGTLSVREIVEYGPITALPMAPPSIRGVTSLRGAAIPVLDLGLCFGSGLTQESARTCIVMLEVRGAGGAESGGLRSAGCGSDSKDPDADSDAEAGAGGGVAP